MLTRLLNWIANRRRQGLRAIFRYWDGQKERAIDPFIAWWALQEDPEYLCSKHDSQIDAGDKDAQAIAVRAVERAFDVKPFDQGGLTHGESLWLLMQFYLYLDALKKSTDPPQTSPAPTESASSDPSITNAA